MDNFFKPFETVLLWVLRYERSIQRLHTENANLRLVLEKSQYKVQHLEKVIRDVTSAQAKKEERLLCERRHENIVLTGELEQSHEEKQQLQNSLDAYKEKYQCAAEKCSSLEDALVNMEQDMTTMAQKEFEQGQALSYLHEHTMTLEHRLKDMEQDNHQAQDIIEARTTELNVLQNKLDEENHKMSALQVEIIVFTKQLQSTQEELSICEDSKYQVTQELQHLQQKCTLLIEKYLDLEEHVRELEFSGEELRAEGQLKSRQIQDMQDTITQLKTDLSHMRDQKNGAHNETLKLRQSMKNLQKIQFKKEEVIKSFKSRLDMTPVSPLSSPLFNPTKTPTLTPVHGLPGNMSHSKRIPDSPSTPKKRFYENRIPAYSNTPNKTLSEKRIQNSSYTPKKILYEDRIPDSPCTPKKFLSCLDEDVLEGHGEAQMTVLLYADKYYRTAS